MRVATMARRRDWRLAFAVVLLLWLGGARVARAEEAPTIAPFRTAYLRIEGTISAQGQVLPVQGEGEIDATKGASRLTVAVLGAVFETVVLDGRTYTRNPLSGRWEYSEGAQAGGFNPAQLAPYDPATIRAAGRNWVRVGPEPVGGVATTRWRADADLNRLIGIVGPAASAGAPPATMDLWIGDADQRLRRLSIETMAAIPGPSAAAASGAAVAPARQALTLTFDNFDAPVAIVAPPGAVPATPGAGFGGGGAILGTPPAVAAGNAPASRAPVASALPAPASPPAPDGRVAPSSILIVRILGIVSLLSIGAVALIARQHRRAQERRSDEA